MQPDNAPIVALEDFTLVRESLTGTIVMTSGGFDPIHPGHISCIQESRKFGDIVVVAVNGDWFLQNKKGKAFQDMLTRAQIVSGLRGVDYVVTFDIEGDTTANEALRAIKPHIFTKGGDRLEPKDIPEWDTCQELGITVEFNVGADKQWSSSWFLSAWKDK